jgi:hypothetical protein
MTSPASRDVWCANLSALSLHKAMSSKLGIQDFLNTWPGIQNVFVHPFGKTTSGRGLALSATAWTEYDAGKGDAMIALTENQRQCIAQGEPLRLSEGNLGLVLIRADVFEGLQRLLENVVAKKVADFPLPVAGLREKAKATPPPQAWFDDESLASLL